MRQFSMYIRTISSTKSFKKLIIKLIQYQKTDYLSQNKTVSYLYDLFHELMFILSYLYQLKWKIENI